MQQGRRERDDPRVVEEQIRDGEQQHRREAGRRFSRPTSWIVARRFGVERDPVRGDRDINGAEHRVLEFERRGEVVEHAGTLPALGLPWTAQSEGPAGWRVLRVNRWRGLPRLFVGRRLAAPLAELAELEALARVRLALRGDVVAPLAVLAREGDRRSLVTCHCSNSLC